MGGPSTNPGHPGLASDGSYQAVKSYLDVDHFIDYMLMNFYLGNVDWDYSNWFAFRRLPYDCSKT